MNKSELVDALAARFDGNRKAAAHALDSVLDTITREVARGEKVAITGFGSFEKRIRDARWVRNPQTGEKVKAKKTAVPKFKAGAELKNVVSGAKKLPQLTVAASGSAMKVAAAPALAAASVARKAAPGGKPKKDKLDVTAPQATSKAATPRASAAKSGAAKSTVSKSTASKSTASKSTASKSTKAAAAKKSPATKSAAPASGGTTKKATTKKAAAKKSAAGAGSTGATKAAAKKSPATKSAATKSAASTTTTKKAPAKKAPAKKAASS